MNNESSSLLDGLRRFYNSVEIFFDRRSLIEEVRLSRTIESQNKPVTARQAFLPCLSIAREFDRGAQLKLIVCPDGNIEQDGISPRWEFFFDLPKRHAKMNCAWFLTWNENADVFDTARIEIVARPFPPQDSSLRKLVKDGKILYRQLTGMWDAEYRRKANLPHRFRDSNNVMREFAQKGLNLTETKITLIAEDNKGKQPIWKADIGETPFSTRFV